jgi:hypothetical protein
VAVATSTCLRREPLSTYGNCSSSRRSPEHWRQPLFSAAESQFSMSLGQKQLNRRPQFSNVRIRPVDRWLERARRRHPRRVTAFANSELPQRVGSGSSSRALERLLHASSWHSPGSVLGGRSSLFPPQCLSGSSRWRYSIRTHGAFDTEYADWICPMAAQLSPAAVKKPGPEKAHRPL